MHLSPHRRRRSRIITGCFILVGEYADYEWYLVVRSMLVFRVQSTCLFAPSSANFHLHLILRDWVKNIIHWVETKGENIKHYSCLFHPDLVGDWKYLLVGTNNHTSGSKNRLNPEKETKTQNKSLHLISVEILRLVVALSGNFRPPTAKE